MRVKLIALFVAAVFMGCNFVDAAEENSSSAKEREVAILSSLYKGTVIQHVKLGDHVKKGQLIFEVRQSVLKAQKRANGVNLKSAEILFHAAEKLIKKHSISMEEYQSRRYDYIAAKTVYETDASKLRTSKYYAPFDGTVTKVVRLEGALGNNDEQVFITRGNVDVDTSKQTTEVGMRWPGFLNLNVKLGEKVKKGQLLFTVNSDEYKIQRSKDKSYLDYTREVFLRASKLRQTGTISLLQYIEARKEYSNALMTLKIDDIKIKQCTVYAPCDGKITKIYRYTGSGNGEVDPVVDITT
ncbi:MAG TPA: hypothetical protein QF753_08355 [Victivallales bacterium]|nr:hypothetical protein [Victivallales bacterium]